MKKHIVEFSFLGILVACHFLFWQFMHYGYLNYAYANAYFDTSFDLLEEAFISSQMMQYVENFLLAFFRWSWLGCTILLLPIISTYFIAKDILKRLNFDSFKILAFFPAITMMLSQHSVHFFLQKSLVVLLIIIAMYLHIIFKDKKFRFFLTIGIFFVFFFLSKLEIVLLCISLLIIELLVSKDKQRYVLVGLHFLFAVFLLILYKIETPTTPKFQTEILILIALQTFPILLFALLANLKKSYVFSNKKIVFLYILIAIGIGSTFISNNGLEKEELYARLDIALLNDDFDEILFLTKNTKLEKQEDLYPYTFYALAKKGQLSQSLFQYKVNLSNFLVEPMPLYTNNKTILSICFYQSLGLLNEAIHQAFQKSISKERGDNFRALCLLVDLNMAKGNFILVEKNLAKLEQTLVHTDFVQSRRKMILSKKAEFKEVDFNNYLHIEKDQFLNISYALFLAKNDSQFVKDYFLCSLLLTGDYSAFCSAYNDFYSADCRKRVYAEALVMARDMGIYKSYFTAPNKVEQDWYMFKSILGNQLISLQEREKRLSIFRNTWWYYYLKEYEHLF